MSEQTVAIREPVQGLSLGRTPEVVLAEAAKAAACLRDVMNKKERKVIINGEPYIEFEDWSTVGSFYNVAGGAEEAVPVEVFGIQGAKALGYVIRTDTGLIISRAVAYCMRDEENWEERPWFQLASMAQTRAAAKALRNVLSRVVVLAGYRPTPAEEMIGGPAKAPNPNCPKCGTAKAVIMGKAEFGGGWVCWKKRGGCGLQWGAEETGGGSKVEDPIRPEHAEAPRPEPNVIQPDPSGFPGRVIPPAEAAQATLPTTPPDRGPRWVATLLEQMERTGKGETAVREHLWNLKSPWLEKLPTTAKDYGKWPLGAVVVVCQWLSALPDKV